MADEDGLLPVGLAPEGKNDDDTRADAAALFGIDLGDSSAAPIDVDADGGEGATVTANSNGSAPSVAGTGNNSKRKLPMWADFEEIYEVINGSRICTKAVCKMCKSTLSARSAAGTGHLKRHQKSCRIKTDQHARVQSRLSYNPDDSVYNWDYKPKVARSELCRLIVKLDLPLGIDIWSSNAKEDYISVVAHYVTADWELQKKVIGLRLIEVKHTGENIVEKVACVIEEFGLLDKVFSVTLDNASSNAKAMETLTPMFAGYLGSEPAPTPSDPNMVKYHLVHQRCACHIINLIVKSGLKRFKPYTEDFRTAINFLNASNQRIALFENFCIAKGVRPRRFGLDMDVRWNATYLMLKHLLPYKDVFSVFINSNYGSTLLTASHWYIADKILEFLKVFYDSTVTLSGVYYPTSPLILHHLLDIITHLHESSKNQNLFSIVYPMKLKYLKYWKDIPLLYSFAFILDPRGKIRGLFNVLTIMQQKTGFDYSSCYGIVKTEIIKLFNKYEEKFGAARSQRRVAQPASITGKRKQAWGRIFGGPGASGVVGPSTASAPSPSLSTSAAACELSTYLDSDNVTAYEDDFDLLLWWRDHKLTYPVLSIMARDIMPVPVSTVSSESCFSLIGRILEERRRRLLPEHVEMLVCIKDWELGERRLQHDVDNQELVDSFKHLYLDEDVSTSGAPSTSTSASVASASGDS
ncbi:zinc finger BED domain-containing protein RICESLEEPER 1-like [Miscanthus floridulus]|uniref:zinc finger BED domain-containing protein RICESLEEPER 1-like n=1 Tax=Miscanthus floridulus TaxID=154761 RepID=UPI0034580A5F